MRLPVERQAPRLALISAAVFALAACGGGSATSDLPPAALANGPQADYPVVLGEPYTVGDVTYTPEDVLNYDEVGYLAADSGNGVTAAHHTLPLPSYAEVTSLDTGRTILVRVERRGPMDGAGLLAVSPAALEQLEASPGAPVRVRRVNPLEEQRALLRAGGPAQPRMDTPMPLVEVLRRKLPDLAVPALATAPALPAIAEPAPSTEERAQRAAQALGGTVMPSGRYFRVRTGPFATRAEAEASLAKVRAAGYSDARILTSG
jgi:rare lipoprotein A